MKKKVKRNEHLGFIKLKINASKGKKYNFLNSFITFSDSYFTCLKWNCLIHIKNKIYVLNSNDFFLFVLPFVLEKDLPVY